MARLLKVIVQPVFVVEQDGEMVEVVAQPIPMTAAQWKALDPPTWAKSGEAEVDAQFPAPDDRKEYRCAACGEVTGRDGHGPGVAVGRDGSPLLTCQVGGLNDPDVEPVE
jgi:hypothetical protein